MKKIIIYRKGNYWIAKCLEISGEIKGKTRKRTLKKVRDTIKGKVKEIKVPNCGKFKKSIEEYEKYEKRDFVYKLVSCWIQKFWYKPHEITDWLGVLLLIWNQGFYRYGLFDFDKLKDFLKRKKGQIKSFRKKEICSLRKNDENKIKELFEGLLESIQIAFAKNSKNKGRKSPVGVAKVLHLLAPNFFPLWDDAIAKEYGCYNWGKNSKDAAEKYVEFCKIQHTLVKLLKKCIVRKDKTSLKLIDEYNYARYSKKWIKDC